MQQLLTAQESELCDPQQETGLEAEHAAALM